MSTLRLFFFLSVLFTGYFGVSGSSSSSSPSAIYPRDGNLTLDPIAVNFTFTVPANSHDPSFSDWVNVVCLHGSCAVQIPTYLGFLSGFLHITAYLTNLLLGIVIIYDPEHASDGVWAQLLTVYSLIISAIIAIYTKGLSRFHSGMTVFLVLSPLSFTLGVYAVLGFCGRAHRLDSILSSRREHLLPRTAVVGFWIIALILLVFTSISNDGHFTAASPCDTAMDTGARAAIIYILACLPYIGVAIAIFSIAQRFVEGITSKAVLIVAATPLLLLVIAVVWAAIESRRSLREQMKMMNINSRSGKFWVNWELFQKRYPFLHFCGVFLIPMIYWVILNEIRLLYTPDEIFSPSFGQVLAVFVVLQPLVQVVMMFPRATRWFRDLAVIRRITGRQQEFVPLPMDSQEENQEMVSLRRSWDKSSG
ncbi:hypothetical protein K438DRAFT_2097132 [Mycena galopus ATCC 62051]|nr:hypothetical protein K438DRAFT_2097132 [Mycena galopus ATCC 62051]